MSTISICPDEHELLAFAMGEPADEAIAPHLDDCPGCRARVERLRAEVSELRLDLGEAADVGPTGSESAGGSGGALSAAVTVPSPMAAALPLAGGTGEPPGAIGRYLVIDRLDTGGAQGEV
jgi:hypothetical protein